MNRNTLLYALLIVGTWGISTALADNGDNDKDTISELRKDVQAYKNQVEILSTTMEAWKSEFKTKKLVVGGENKVVVENGKVEAGKVQAKELDTQWVAVWDNDWGQIGSALEYRTLRTNGIRLDDYVSYAPTAFGPQWARDGKLAPGSTRIGMAADTDGAAAIYVNAGSQQGELWRLHVSKENGVWATTQWFGGEGAKLTLPRKSQVQLAQGSSMIFTDGGSLAMNESQATGDKTWIKLASHFEHGSTLQLRNNKGATGGLALHNNADHMQIVSQEPFRGPRIKAAGTLTLDPENSGGAFKSVYLSREIEGISSSDAVFVLMNKCDNDDIPVLWAVIEGKTIRLKTQRDLPRKLSVSYLVVGS